MTPLKKIIDLISNQQDNIDEWFQKQWQGITPVPYFSCDIRHAKYKIGVVDTNLFPGGFNNLCNSFSKQTTEAFKEFFKTNYPQVKNIALLAEGHTRNKFYLLNVLRIQDFLTKAGFNTRVTMLLERYPETALKIQLDDSNTLEVFAPEINQDQKINLGDDFTADIVLSNNDFSAGLKQGWDNLKIIPHPNLGWHIRKKSDHFNSLQKVVNHFCTDFSLDPWLLTPITESVSGISSGNLDALVNKVDDVIAKIKTKYAEYNIGENPYVFIKNDSGTYGLGLTWVNSGEEVLQLNRKKRNKLFATKAGNQSEQFIVQEGIPSYDSYSGFPIEPVIYGVGKEAIGGFFRIHEKKGPYESLNSPGMSFSCLCLHKLDEPHESDFINCKSKEELVIGSRFLAKLAALAAAKEV